MKLTYLLLFFVSLNLLISFSFAKTSLVASVQNNVDQNLTMITCHNSFGAFGKEPPAMIMANEFGGWEANSNSSLGSTLGSCQYGIGNGLGVVIFQWSLPDIGYNSYSINTPTGYTGSYTGGSGWQANVEYFLSVSNSSSLDYAD